VEDLITISANDNNYKSSPIVNFDEVDFPPAFFAIFKSLGYVRPTKIQANAIPIALEFFDIIGVAKTGSGKTLSFVLPVLMAIQDEKEFCKRNNKVGPVDQLYDNQKKPRALVMAPTRELVCQIYECAKPFVKAVDLDVACIYGGADSHPQRHDLARGADLLIATPGRLHDFIQRGHVELNEVFILVLDEADRMLDMGFLPQVKSIVDYLKPKRQTLLWSATWPREVEDLSRNLCKNRPITIRVGNEGLTINPNITQHVILCEDDGKKREVIGLLRRCQKCPTDKTLIFTSTKRMCDVLAKTLENEGFPALAIHGDKTQPVPPDHPGARQDPQRLQGARERARRHRRGLARPRHQEHQGSRQLRLPLFHRRLRAPHRAHRPRRKLRRKLHFLLAQRRQPCPRPHRPAPQGAAESPLRPAPDGAEWRRKQK
jgi:superfamily II DNA/RNA helicase